MDTTSVSSIQSLDRVFLIIELLSKYPKGISLTEICNVTQLPKSTTARMLTSLISHGYATQNIENKKYRLTMRLFEVGSRVIGGTNVLSIARPYLENLSNICKEAVHLVLRDKDEVVYFYKEEPFNSIVRMSSYVGLRNPMYCTGVGKSILAFLSDEEFFSIWKRTDLTRFTPNTIVSFSIMQRELACIREQGYAIDNEEHELGIRCIAAPILDFDANPFAAISLSAPAVRLNDLEIQKYAPLILETAKNISRCFGGSMQK